MRAMQDAPLRPKTACSDISWRVLDAVQRMPRRNSIHRRDLPAFLPLTFNFYRHCCLMIFTRLTKNGFGN